MSTRVRVRVPHDASMLMFPSGDQVNVNVDEAGAYADILEDDARLILFSGLPESLPWRESNEALVQMMKPPTRTPVVRVADLEHAANMSRPTNPFDRTAIARDALAAWRGGR